VMTVSLSSLAMQKILLTVAGNKVFSGLLTLFGLLSVLLICAKRSGMLPLILKLFIILALVRFSLGVVVLTNSAVDQLFLSAPIEKNSAQLGDFKDSINNLQREKELSKTARTNIRQSIEQAELAKEEIKAKAIPVLDGKLKSVEAKLKIAISKLETERENAGLINTWNPLADNPKIQVAIDTVDKLTSEQDAISEKITQMQQKVASLEEKIASNASLLSGDSGDIVSMFNGIKQNLTISSIEAKVSGFVQNIIDLLVLFILKTILLPLMFFYLLITLVKAAWHTDWKQYISDAQ